MGFGKSLARLGPNDFVVLSVFFAIGYFFLTGNLVLALGVLLLFSFLYSPSAKFLNGLLEDSAAGSERVHRFKPVQLRVEGGLKHGGFVIE